ncbi:putative Casein kinase I [Blattamonas nauphoetae]|uniref:non-specific serine/threonine protein kinase n=1 Tax=Blattamonas nauphoetae TaxID=2049346 RepID=A0ABQ9YHL2_9EUKA|nr:putative Casein kinase I [Blattamonas nauphoetae]
MNQNQEQLWYSPYDTYLEDVKGTDFQNFPMMLGRRYRMLRLIGKGSFGAVFLCESSESHKFYATKVEIAHTKAPKLHQEYCIGRALQQLGFPEVRYFWNNRDYHAMVMELLGGSFDDYHKRMNHQFSIYTVVQIAIQCITRIATMHELGFIHRDIKPNNFLFGTGQNEDTVFLIDFGLSKAWRDPNTGQHFPCTRSHGLVGTLRFISMNVHSLIEPSRRDDLISLSYMFVFLHKGCLPWQFREAMPDQERYQKIVMYKQQYPLEYLFADMPVEFANFHIAVSNLQFDETPNYAELLQPFHNLQSQIPEHMRSFDWNLVNQDPSLISVNTQDVSTGIMNNNSSEGAMMKDDPGAVIIPSQINQTAVRLPSNQPSYLHSMMGSNSSSQFELSHKARQELQSKPKDWIRNTDRVYKQFQPDPNKFQLSFTAEQRQKALSNPQKSTSQSPVSPFLPPPPLPPPKQHTSNVAIGPNGLVQAMNAMDIGMYPQIPQFPSLESLRQNTAVTTTQPSPTTLDFPSLPPLPQASPLNKPTYQPAIETASLPHSISSLSYPSLDVPLPSLPPVQPNTRQVHHAPAINPASPTSLPPYPSTDLPSSPSFATAHRSPYYLPLPAPPSSLSVAPIPRSLSQSQQFQSYPQPPSHVLSRSVPALPLKNYLGALPHVSLKKTNQKQQDESERDSMKVHTSTSSLAFSLKVQIPDEPLSSPGFLPPISPPHSPLLSSSLPNSPKANH